MENFVTAIIVAAGSSTRMGGSMSKQFVPLLGKPAIQYTLRAFEKSYIIDSMVVVCRPQDEIALRAIIDRCALEKIHAVVYGGSTRDESVSNGIKASPEGTTHFAIHDGARPLVTQEDIAKVVKTAFKTKAAAPGTYVTDTIKLVDSENYIISTPVRSTLRAVQTPQVFEKELYLKACERARENRIGFTDDCQLVESIGERVRVVQCSETNIKLTTQGDIAVAESILKRRRG